MTKTNCELISDAVLKITEYFEGTSCDDIDYYADYRCALLDLIESVDKRTEVDIADARRLDWLINSEAIIKCGGGIGSDEDGFVRGYWLSFLALEEDQIGIFKTSREAIDAAMQAEKGGA